MRDDWTNGDLSNGAALRVEGLGKRYQLGLTHANSLGEVVSRWSRRLRGLPPVEEGLRSEEDPVDPAELLAPAAADEEARPPSVGGAFWALRDVSFEVRPGEVVGVIGRNGAGKSTLLKILSRVTAPTEGRVAVEGRVGSLLEVGTGFHPELTGRENVFLNATLLGMSRREVAARLDEIVAFAGVGEFLDTPVKRYSSGMKVRLGFAVAAHLEPEVLIVDEVLAVGDASFQRKCLGKMQDVAGQGRTVLFVSHNMGAVRALCGRAVLMKHGRVTYDGETEEAVQRYLHVGGEQAGRERYWPAGEPSGGAPDAASGGHLVRPVAARVEGPDGATAHALTPHDEVTIRFEFDLLRPAAGVRSGVSVRTADGVVLFGSNQSLHPSQDPEAVVPAGRYTVCAGVPADLFNAGGYFVTLGMDRPPFVKPTFWASDVLQFEVEDLRGHGFTRALLPGVVRPAVRWDVAPAGR